MAHYLLFMGATMESIFLWIAYMLARWMVTRPRLANDMSILYKAPTAAPANDNYWNVYAGVSRNLKTISSPAIVLTLWFMTRYGYHLSIYFLIERINDLVFVTSSLFNLLKPGTVLNKKSRVIVILQITEKITLQVACICQQLFNGN